MVGVLGPDMRRLMNEHPGISARLVIALGTPAAGDQRASLAPVLPDGAEPRGGGAEELVGEQEIAAPKGNPAASDVLVTATQADLAQLAGSSRESASRFLAVLERAGVISQGRGRLVVHDPEALKQYVF